MLSNVESSMPWLGRRDAISEEFSVSLNDDAGGSAYLDRAEQRDQHPPLLITHVPLDSIRVQQSSLTHGIAAL